MKYVNIMKYSYKKMFKAKSVLDFSWHFSTNTKPAPKKVDWITYEASSVQSH